MERRKDYFRQRETRKQSGKEKDISITASHGGERWKIEIFLAPG